MTPADLQLVVRLGVHALPSVHCTTAAQKYGNAFGTPNWAMGHAYDILSIYTIHYKVCIQFSHNIQLPSREKLLLTLPNNMNTTVLTAIYWRYMVGCPRPSPINRNVTISSFQ